MIKKSDSQNLPKVKISLLPYKQKNNWTCGPAIVKIILAAKGISKNINELIKELKTTKKNGTQTTVILKFLKKYKIAHRQKAETSLAQLKKDLKSNLVVVSFWMPYYQESHFSIVTGIDEKYIYFHDTWFGFRHRLTLRYFLKNWFDEDYRRWMLQ